MNWILKKLVSWKALVKSRSTICKQQSAILRISRYIAFICIRYSFCWRNDCKDLARAVNHLLDFKKYSLEDLQNLEDIGPKVGGSIYHFFRNKDNIKMLQQLEKLGLKLKNEKKEHVTTGGNLTGQSFLFTGTLPTLKRSDAEAMVEKNGGTIVGGVSSKLNYLVVGEDAGSKLEKAKKINTVKIISEEEFLKMIGKK